MWEEPSGAKCEISQVGNLFYKSSLFIWSQCRGQSLNENIKKNNQKITYWRGVQVPDLMNLHNVNYNSLSHRVNRLSRQGQGATYKLKEYPNNNVDWRYWVAVGTTMKDKQLPEQFQSSKDVWARLQHSVGVGEVGLQRDRTSETIYIHFYIGVSSSGKTQHFDCCIRRFESCHPSHTITYLINRSINLDRKVPELT